MYVYITSQDVSALCCECYLTNEIINVLIRKDCDAANECFGRSIFAMLPSDVSTQFLTSAVHNLNVNVELSTVETIFIPIHRNGKTLANLYEITTLQDFLARTWSKVSRFTVPIPDQPNASGSCGVGVIYCVRDLSHGIQEKFTSTYKESPKLRAQLMIELLKS